MRLGEVITGSGLPDGGPEISALAYDHREVGPGTLFFCVGGLERDGHDFAPAALERGAVALVTERKLDLGVPEVVVPSSRRAMGPAAARFHGDPSTRLKVVGITGTNGKTTTVWLVRSLMTAVGRGCGLIGTVQTVVGGDDRPAVRTTPEAIDLQRLLAEMAEAGEVAAAIEVSSHALDLGRVDGTEFAVGVFTNLTQDHLDFHGSMEAYWEAKRRLFTDLRPETSVINVDDPRGAQLAAEIEGSVTVSIGGEADWTAGSVSVRHDGTDFILDGPGGPHPVSIRLPGLFNVRNAVEAVAAAVALGVDPDDAVAALARVEGVPGRMERVEAGQPFAVIVDYAHTPDSLENVLVSARGLTDRRVICVVGCGGDRDTMKRPLMGGIAAELADVAILTSDNPRSEDPEAIISQMSAGAAGRAEAVIDRAEAIAQSMRLAEPGDVVLIAGKGHEQGQEFADGRVVPFDDRSVAAAALARIGWDK